MTEREEILALIRRIEQRLANLEALFRAWFEPSPNGTRR